MLALIARKIMNCMSSHYKSVKVPRLCIFASIFFMAMLSSVARAENCDEPEMSQKVMPIIVNTWLGGYTNKPDLFEEHFYSLSTQCQEFFIDWAKAAEGWQVREDGTLCQSNFCCNDNQCLPF